MEVSLDELIENKRSSSLGGRRGGGRQGGSKGFRGGKRGGGTLNFRSNGASGNSGGPMRRGRSIAKRSNGLTPYSKVKKHVNELTIILWNSCNLNLALSNLVFRYHGLLYKIIFIAVTIV
jgi:hypothetical protein